MEIITGYTGKPHVTAEQDRDVNEGIFDTGSFVLKTGSQLAAELVSNNEIKVRDGVLVIQGCTAVIKKNTYDPVTIANGSQGMKRIDLIVARYNKNEETKIEEVMLKVIQGTPNASTAAVPTYKTGDIQSGDLVADMPLYKVTLDGLNVTSVDKMFTVIPTLPELSSNLAKTNTVLENRKPIFIDSTAQGTANLDTNSFLKSGVTYAFIVIVSSNISSESYKQEIACALNNVNMGNNGNYYKLVSTFTGKCSKGDKLHITSYKNGGTWTLFATRAIFIPVS
mgnify:FL=1|jgi:hypothetical protein